jgi:hypothetical protein
MAASVRHLAARAPCRSSPRTTSREGPRLRALAPAERHRGQEAGGGQAVAGSRIPLPGGEAAGEEPLGPGPPQKVPGSGNSPEGPQGPGGLWVQGSLLGRGNRAEGVTGGSEDA